MKKFITRGTGTELDLAPIFCDDVAREMRYVDPEGNGKVSRLRKFRGFGTEFDDIVFDQNVNGIWVEDGYLVPEKEEVDDLGAEGIEGFGSFIRTHIVEFALNKSEYVSIVVNEFENKVGVCITTNLKPILNAIYIRKVHLGSVKEMMEKCTNIADVDRLIKVIKEFD